MFVECWNFLYFVFHDYSSSCEVAKIIYFSFFQSVKHFLQKSIGSVRTVFSCFFPSSSCEGKRRLWTRSPSLTLCWAAAWWVARRRTVRSSPGVAMSSGREWLSPGQAGTGQESEDRRVLVAGVWGLQDMDSQIRGTTIGQTAYIYQLST